MTALTIHGRGGQGGVTLAKLIATSFFLRGRYAQAFGLYAAERSGAPIQAFVRIDDVEITNHNQVRRPDHVIVLDRTLIGPAIADGLHDSGWLILNSPEEPQAFADVFNGRHVATVDATAIALHHKLGTRTLPIVNSTMFGAVARIFGLDPRDIDATLDDMKLNASNRLAAQDAYEAVLGSQLDGEVPQSVDTRAAGEPVSLFDEAVGAMPRIHTGNWATHRPQRRHLTPPCNHGCPAGNDVQALLDVMTRGDADAGLRILLDTSPLPGVCGRVCPAPCMDACNRRLLDEAVNIREIERFVADYGRRPEVTTPWRADSVAVVGSGPAGLSATYTLARLGYPVHLYESGSELGGVLRTGIPEYRLPREVLDQEIGFILNHGVQVTKRIQVNREDLLDLSRDHAAVFVATGLQQPRTLELDHDGSGVVIEGLDFLDEARRLHHRLDGRRVCVIGGGNTAMDVARTAVRLGARPVRVLYRRTREQMPAIAEEVTEALEEGVALDELVAPFDLRHDRDQTVLVCRRMRLGEPDASGRPRAVPESGEHACFEVPCDLVIMALGQDPDPTIWPEDAELQDGEPEGTRTAAALVAGGDFISSAGTVAAAIGSGRHAALRIHQRLSGEHLVSNSKPPLAESPDVNPQRFTEVPQEHGRRLQHRWRRQDFGEVNLGFTTEPGQHPAESEAQRCFSCGVCNHCDLCVTSCPEGILFREGDSYTFDYEYCKGCALCAAQCPRGVIEMSEL